VLAALLAAPGCAPAAGDGAPGGEPLGPLAGMRPLARLERSELSTGLKSESPGGFHVGIFASEEPLLGSVSYAWLPLEERATGGDVDAHWLDAGLGVGLPLARGDPAVAPLARVAAGASVLFLDFERNSCDTCAAGMYARAGLGLWTREKRFGLEVFGDLHGWIGVDGHGLQTAWAATAGFSVIVRF